LPSDPIERAMADMNMLNIPAIDAYNLSVIQNPLFAGEPIIPNPSTASLSGMNFWGGFKNEMTNLTNWITGASGYIGKKYGEIRAPIYQALSEDYDALAAGLKGFSSNLSDEALNLASRYGNAFFNAEELMYFGRAIGGPEFVITMGAIDFFKNPTMRNLFDVTGAVAGGIGGGFLGGIAAVAEETILPIASTPVAITTLVAASGAGAVFGQMKMDELYENLENRFHSISNR
jgi:hypothetical protein